MKFYNVLLALTLCGCGTNEMDHWIKNHNDPCDLGMIDCEVQDTSNSSSFVESSSSSVPESEENLTQDIPPSFEEPEQPTSEDSEIDPNACSPSLSSIEDNNNEPQGVSKDGITFTSFLQPASVMQIFYYKKQESLNNDKIIFEKFFQDEGGNINFTLTIDSAYAGQGYFYVKNSSNNKCFRGEFPKDQFSAPSYTLVEVKDR